MKRWVQTIWVGVLLVCVAVGVSACGESRPPKAVPAAKPFYLGGDISMLARIEALGGTYKEQGKTKDCIAILRAHGCNCFRLRLFVNPNGVNAVVNDLPYTLKLAKRIKAAGGSLLLDIHYSDTWADPGKQIKPAAWAKLSFEQLERQVETYTRDVIAKFKQAGVLPEMVQIGNEINPGMLWPEGKLAGKDAKAKSWSQFTRLLKAGIRGARAPLAKTDGMKIMIHIAAGGNKQRTKFFFTNLIAHNVPFDIIGQSYYPWWHGTLADLKANLKYMAETFKKDILVVETAYPYRGKPGGKAVKNFDWPITPQGQKMFLNDVIRAVREAPNQRGIGVIWWYPESVPVKGLRMWADGSRALFDCEGNVLESAEAFKAPAKAAPRK